MKSILHITLIAGILLLDGCEDYLDVKPRGYDVAEKVAHYEGLLYGTETIMLNEVFPYMCFEWETNSEAYENIYSLMGADVTNAYKWEEHIFRPDENCGEWNHFAGLLYPINVVANGVMDAIDGTPEQKRALYAEARVLRAYMTFMMAQFFGEPYDAAKAETSLSVPIITKAATVGNDFTRRTMKEVYNFVITEMTQAIPDIPIRKEHHLRAFSVTANAMLGRVYWTMGDYENAVKSLGTAMEQLSLAGCGLIDYNTMEVEGEIAYPVDDLLNPELVYNVESMSNIWSSMYPSYYGSVLLYLKWDLLKSHYTKSDLRLCFISGLESGVTAYKKFNNTDTYYINLSKFVGNIGITVPDLYLMYCESLARTGEYDTARALLEELRRTRISGDDYTVDAADGDELIKFIVAERVREFVGYGNLWFDMRRLWSDPLFEFMKEFYTHTDGEQIYTLSEERLTMNIPPQITAWHPEY